MSILKRFVLTALIGCAGIIAGINEGQAVTSIPLPPTISGPYAYITNYSSDNVSVIDTATDTVTATVAVGFGPYGVAVSPDASRVYVANYVGSSVSVINAANNSVLATVPIATRPYGLAVSPDGNRVYVVAYYSNNVSVIDTATNTVIAVIRVGQRPHGVVVSRDGKRVYVANYATNDLTVIDATLNSVAATIALPANSNPFGLAQTLDSSTLYVTGWSSNAVYVVDTASGVVTATIPVGVRPVGVAVTPDTGRVYVANYSGSAAATTVSVIDPATNTVITNIPLPSGVAPSGVSVHPDGGRVYVASYSTGSVFVIDPASNAIIKTVTVGTRPYAFGSFISQPQPALSLFAPLSRDLNDPMPTFTFNYGTLCNGNPCLVSNNYFSTFGLNALLNNQQIGNLVTFTPTPLRAGQPGGAASYTPTTRLPEGSNVLNAQVQDRFGRLSSPIAVPFTIDTIAPKFLMITPPNGSVYLNPTVTVSGSIDDPTARIVLGNVIVANTNNQLGPNFAFQATLLPGLNALNLYAVDSAGNATHAPLSLSYTPFTLNVGNPQNGATLYNNQVTVTGNFSGATSATVNVNGLAASVSGTNFSVANVPLVYGQNTLTLTAIRSDDGQVLTQRLTVTSLAPNITITAPTAGATVSTNSVLVTGSVAGPVTAVTVNGVGASLSAGTFSASVPLVYGSNTLTVKATTVLGISTTQTVNVTSSVPTLAITSPMPNATLNSASATVTGTWQGPPTTIVSVNGVAAAITGNTYSATVPLTYGSNTLTATATAPGGATASSAVTVTSTLPTLLITNPATNATIATSTVTVSGTFMAPPSTTVSVNGVAAVLSGSSYSAMVPLTYGSNTLTVILTAPNGATVTQTRNLTSLAPALSITSPTPNATINAATVSVTGTLQGPVNSSVMVNGVTATVIGNTYSATNVPLSYGSNTLTATATAPDGSTATTSVTVSGGNLTLTLTSPANGASIPGDSVLVTGIFQGPPNTGVTVNGVVANVDNGKFYANNVPLQPGANTLTATYTTQDGQTGKQAINVNSTGTNPIRVSAEPSQGIAPLTVSFDVENKTGNPIQRIDADFDGNGTIDFTTTNPSAAIQFIYNTPGFYQARITVTDSLGNVYQQTIVVNVLSGKALDAMLQAIWSNVKTKLTAGQIEPALTYFSSVSRDKYRTVLNDIAPGLAGMFGSFPTIYPTQLGDGDAEYFVVMPNGGINYGYYIYFMQDPDGVWRVHEL